MLPGHFFVRLHDRDRVRNVELLRSGEEMPDDWYRERFPFLHRVRTSTLARSSPGEVLAIVAYDVGNERRRQGRLADARRAYELAVTRFSEFARSAGQLGRDAITFLVVSIPLTLITRLRDAPTRASSGSIGTWHSSRGSARRAR